MPFDPPLRPSASSVPVIPSKEMRPENCKNTNSPSFMNAFSQFIEKRSTPAEKSASTVTKLETKSTTSIEPANKVKKSTQKSSKKSTQIETTDKMTLQSNSITNGSSANLINQQQEKSINLFLLESNAHRTKNPLLATAERSSSGQTSIAIHSKSILQPSLLKVNSIKFDSPTNGEHSNSFTFHSTSSPITVNDTNIAKATRDW